MLRTPRTVEGIGSVVEERKSIKSLPRRGFFFSQCWPSGLSPADNSGLIYAHSGRAKRGNRNCEVV